MWCRRLAPVSKLFQLLDHTPSRVLPVVHRFYCINKSTPIATPTSVQSGVQVKDPGVEALFPPEQAPPESTELSIRLTEEELDAISGGDEEIVKKVKYIQLEHEVYRQEGHNVPSVLKPSHWKELLSLPSPSTRRKYYNFLFLNEMKTLNQKYKKSQKQQERIAHLIETNQLWAPKSSDYDPFGTIYGLGRNTLSLRLYDTTINRFNHNKVVQAMRFGRPLVVDCGYDEYMTHREAKNCAKQVELMLSENRSHVQPFDLHLCNAPREGRMMELLLKINPALYDDSHPTHVTEKSYLDVFKREELVYLSPHAKDELEEWSEDDVYIIGAMVDKTDGKPLSLAKGKREGVRLRKLPLDKYLVWGMGGKSLTINQMILIMLDLRRTGDWKAALEHVPKRKLNREWHPYPDQEQAQDSRLSDGPMSREPYGGIRQADRRENRSRVRQDFDEMRGGGVRGGFRGGGGGGGMRREREESFNRGRFSVRGIFDE